MQNSKRPYEELNHIQQASEQSEQRKKIFNESHRRSNSEAELRNYIKTMSNPTQPPVGLSPHVLTNSSIPTHQENRNTAFQHVRPINLVRTADPNPNNYEGFHDEISDMQARKNLKPEHLLTGGSHLKNTQFAENDSMLNLNQSSNFNTFVNINSTMLSSLLNAFSSNISCLAQQMSSNAQELNSNQPQEGNYAVSDQSHGNNIGSQINSQDSIEANHAKIMNLLNSKNSILSEIENNTEATRSKVNLALSGIKGMREALERTFLGSENTPSISIINDDDFLDYSSEATMSKILERYREGNILHRDYELILDPDCHIAFYKERNFKLVINLVDRANRPVLLADGVSVAIAVYNSDAPPKRLESNNLGNKILKGVVKKTICKGSVTFDKIQITEVTSHMRNGWIFIVVYPISDSQDTKDVIMQASHIRRIQPFILDKVIVKSKKNV